MGHDHFGHLQILSKIRHLGGIEAKSPKNRPLKSLRLTTCSTGQKSLISGPECKEFVNFNSRSWDSNRQVTYDSTCLQPFSDVCSFLVCGESLCTILKATGFEMNPAQTKTTALNSTQRNSA